MVTASESGSAAAASSVERTAVIASISSGAPIDDLLHASISIMVVAALFACSSSFTAPVASRVPCSRAASARMMFGGAGARASWSRCCNCHCVDARNSCVAASLSRVSRPRSQMKMAKDMFNPEMMKKYSEVGVKVQALQTELASTEVECDGRRQRDVKVSGTQAPAGVTVTDALCATGAEAASATLTQALKDAHMKSAYAQEKMAGLYSEMGLTQGMAGMQ